MSAASAEVNVTIRTYEVPLGWDGLSRENKLWLTRALEPVHVEQVHNTAVQGLLEYLVDNLDKDQSINKDASHLAVGTDDTTPASSNSSLNNEVFRGAVTSTTDQLSTLKTSTLIDTSEANGNTLKEVGLFTASSGGTLLNHAIISDVVKTDAKAVTIDVSLTFSAA